MSKSKYEERREKARERMRTEILNIGRNEEAWREWMEFRARFHDYSFRNRILIKSQCDGTDAQIVKGYRDWLKNGRQVAGGENGQMIWCPIPDTADDEEEAEEEGVEVGEEYVSKYDIGYVFAWHQTIPIVDRAPEEIGANTEAKSIQTVDHPRAKTAAEAGTETLPEPIPTLDGSSHADLLRGVRRFAERRGNDVRTLPEGYRKKGDYEIGMDGTGRIRLQESLPPNQAANVLTHEVAHALTFARYDEEELKDLGKSGMEIVAEGASYMACYMFGLDTAESSFPYLRSWSEGGSLNPDKDEDEEQIREAIEKHLKAIGIIADSIREGVLEEMDASEVEGSQGQPSQERASRRDPVPA